MAGGSLGATAAAVDDGKVNDYGEKSSPSHKACEEGGVLTIPPEGKEEEDLLSILVTQKELGCVLSRAGGVSSSQWSQLCPLVSEEGWSKPQLLVEVRTIVYVYTLCHCMSSGFCGVVDPLPSVLG